MVARLHLEDLHRAWKSNDPELVDMIIRLVTQEDETPEVPIREGALTFERFLQDIRSWSFQRKSKEEQRQYRVEQLKLLELPDAEVPLPDRLKVHEIILLLWADNSAFARSCLLKIIAQIPLVYGPWRALKRIFKESEEKRDTEIYGALAARFDIAIASYGHSSQVRTGTLSYLCRRAWRFLRQTGLTLPATYADTAADFLAYYTDETNWNRTWIANHIFFHEWKPSGKKAYGRSRFSYYREPEGGLLKHRAYAELWQRSPRPLFTLIERAKCDRVWEFATTALKTDFRAVLREVEPLWVARLVNVGSKAIDSFVVWILKNVPKFEQSAFRTLGLHETVLKLFDSPSKEAREYAAEYARTHARDLPVPELVRLANNDNDAVRKLANDLLQSRDPRTEIGLEAWGQLLETKYGTTLASSMIKKHFGASELTPEWFAERLFSPSQEAFQFAKGYLLQVHSLEKLGVGYFQGLMDRCEPSENNSHYNLASFVLSYLPKFDLSSLDTEFLKRLMLHPYSSNSVFEWINSGKLQAKKLGSEFLKSVAYHPTWETDPWLLALKQSDKAWMRELEFDEYRSVTILGFLADVRKFSSDEVGMDWLLQLVARSEPHYHEFAVDRLIKSFSPADFAPPQTTTTPTTAAPSVVDLQKATFLFTGKLSTMTRKEAEDKVKAANGIVSGSVTNKLHYLVIGDEGSPLYGAGSKGTKQLKAEELNESGSNIKIISETAFLQMLSSGAVTPSQDRTIAGCERLWKMVIAPGPADAPIASFARRYIKRHHVDICPAETDRPVDSGREIPTSFLTFDLFRPLFFESRKPLRDFALELAKWEFARWHPPAMELIELCEATYSEVRKFVADALLAEESPKTKRYRIDPKTLSPAAIYSFCESINDATRSLGMQLIQRDPKLQLPEELFRLTESPDRKVRAFVIRSLWSLYRDRGVTPDWKPTIPIQSTIGAKAKKEAAKAEEIRGPGVPHRPEKRPSDDSAMASFLRRILFEIPPGRMEPVSEDDKGILSRLKPLSARKAKLSLIEIMRDLAMEDSGFAKAVVPAMEEFMISFGRSEQEACLVAVTRIHHQHTSLAV